MMIMLNYMLTVITKIQLKSHFDIHIEQKKRYKMTKC
uniref:Uncharacterized protein n=1 Tax=Tetranychus urticae TaxID=32264 RepID=T1KBX1_TETUR